MSKRIRTLLIFAVVLQSACASAVEESGVETPRSFTYVKAFEITPSSVGGGLGTGITLQIGTKTYLNAEDVLAPARVCDSGKYECFESCSFTFGIPRLLFRTTRGWTFGGHNYQVLRYYEAYSLGGQEIKDVYIVEGPVFHCALGNDTEHILRENTRRLFYYSAHNGLFAFGDLSTEIASSVALYLLQGSCGFASSDKCATGKVLPNLP
jgi:hypothetical protein